MGWWRPVEDLHMLIQTSTATRMKRPARTSFTANTFSLPSGLPLGAKITRHSHPACTPHGRVEGRERLRSRGSKKLPEGAH